MSKAIAWRFSRLSVLMSKHTTNLGKEASGTDEAVAGVRSTAGLGVAGGTVVFFSESNGMRCG